MSFFTAEVLYLSDSEQNEFIHLRDILFNVTGGKESSLYDPCFAPEWYGILNRAMFLYATNGDARDEHTELKLKLASVYERLTRAKQ